MQRPQRLQRDKNSSSSKAPGGRNGLAPAGFIKRGEAAPATSKAVPDRRTSRREKTLPSDKLSWQNPCWRTMSNEPAGQISLQRPHKRQSEVVAACSGAAAPVGQTLLQRPQWMQEAGGFARNSRHRERKPSSRPVGQRYVHQKRGAISSPLSTMANSSQGI